MNSASSSAAVGQQRQDQFVRPSDRLQPQDYPEWLQADADFHRRPRWGARLAIGAGILLAILALLAATTALRHAMAPRPAIFGEAQRPVAP